MRERQLGPELMDRSDLDPVRHRQALDGLARLNRWSRSAAALWRPLARLAHASAAPLQVLDLACGGGDNIIRLAGYARRAGVSIRFTACDISDRALQHTAQLALTAGVPVDTFRHDVLTAPIPPGYDVVMSSLFLHHLERADAVGLLGRMGRAARRLVVVHDLVRSRAGLTLAHLACRTLTRSEVVRHDGPQSVRSAFTVGEMRAMADQAGLAAVRIRRSWPQRFLLTAAPGMAT